MNNTAHSSALTKSVKDKSGKRKNNEIEVNATGKKNCRSRPTAQSQLKMKAAPLKRNMINNTAAQSGAGKRGTKHKSEKELEAGREKNRIRVRRHREKMGIESLEKKRLADKAYNKRGK